MGLFIGTIQVASTEFVYVSTVSADNSDDQGWLDNHFIIRAPRGVDADIYKGVVRNILANGLADAKITLE